MRFNLNLSIINKNINTIPINYQYELSSCIYKTIARGNADYANWLHSNGFNLDAKQFRLFTFSNLQLPEYKLNKENQCIAIIGNTVSLTISFLPERSTEEFIKGIFANQILEVGDKYNKASFNVANIELQSQPDFSQPIYGKTISPLCITVRKDINKIDYLSPDDVRARELLKNNLLSKYEAFYGNKFQENAFLEWKTLNQPQSKLLLIKKGTPQQTQIRGFNCDFILNANPELLKIAYNAGLGEKNSMGFGCVEVK